MAITIGDVLLKLGVEKGDFDQAMKEAQLTVVDTAKKMNDSLKVIGGAFTAVGAAGLKMVADARQLNAELGQTALTLGVTTKEMRDLALKTTDVTFPLKSVADTFELLARAGVRNTTEMLLSAKAFDTLADATGSSAEVVADVLLPAFKLFGEAIPTTSKELDKFTWLTKKTLVNLSDFGTLLTRMSPYMKQLNLTMDDTVAILAALGERGISGTAATLKLRTAITQAASSGETLNDILDISQDELDGFVSQMEDATGITQEYAEINAQQFTIIDKLKQLFSEWSLKIGSLLTAFEPLLALLTTLGPILIFVSTSVGQNTIAWILHTKALIADKIAALAAAAANTALYKALGPLGVVLTLLALALGPVTAALMNLNHEAKESTHQIMLLDEATIKHIRFQRVFDEAIKGNTLSLTENTAAIEKMGEKYQETISQWQYAQTQAGKLGLTMEDLTGYLLEQGWTVDRIKQAYVNYGDEINKFAHDFEIDLREVARASEVTYASMMSDTEKATQQAIDNAQKVTDTEKERLDDRAQYYRDFSYERLDLIDKQMMAEIMAANPDLAASLAGYNDQIEAIRERDDARDKADEDARIAAIQQRLATEELSAEERASLERDLASLQDSQLKEKLIRERNLKIASLDMDTYFNGLKTKQDTWLTNQTDNYNKDLEALKALYTDKEFESAEFVKEYNRILEGIIKNVNTTVTITTVNKTVSTTPLKTMATGGIIPEPTLLSSMRTGLPYAIAGEAGAERVSPMTSQTANITILLDGRVIGRAIGQPLVDEIRVKTGIKI